MKQRIIIILIIAALVEAAVIASLYLGAKIKGDGHDRWILNLEENEFVRIITPDNQLEVDISFRGGSLIFGTATDDGVGVNYRIKNGAQVLSTHLKNNEFLKDSDGNGIPDFHAKLNNEEGNQIFVPTEITWEPKEMEFQK